MAPASIEWSTWDSASVWGEFAISDAFEGVWDQDAFVIGSLFLRLDCYC